MNEKDRLFYGWVVVLSFLVIGIALYGIHFSFGLFFKSIESEFNLTRTATSAIVSTNLILAGISAFLAGLALDRYGPKTVILFMGLFTGISLLFTSQVNSYWQLFLTYSLLLSMGTGAVYVVSTSTVSRWFKKKRGLALGVAGSGVGLGTILMAPFATFLIINLDWRMSYLIVGLVAWIIVIPLSWLLKREPGEIGALPDGANLHSSYIESEETSIQATDSPLSKVFRTRSFWLFLFCWLLFSSCLFLILTHLIPHLTDIGFSAQEAARVLSLIGVSAIAGRLIMGTVSDKIGRKRTSIIAALLQASAMFWLIEAQELWMFYIFSLLFGFAYSGFGASMGALIGDILGLSKIGTIFGLLDIGFGIGSAIGSAIGGIIFDISNSYTIAFIIGATSMLIVTLLVALIPKEVKRN
ncbi:MFS transporter [Chloroflexota bacterium]